MKKKTLSKKKAFTLLELALCLVILALAAGFIGNKAIGFIGHYRFEKDVKQFKMDMEQLQVLALSYQADISLNIFQKDGALVYQAHTNEPGIKLSTIGGKNILDTIGYTRFNKKPIQNPWSLRIFSNGKIEPRGVLEVRPKEHDERARIVDFSQPLQIKIYDKYPDKRVENLPKLEDVLK
jgi:prepilin-type N-terminal cleavage/methylation domain-containing protein